MQADPHLPKNHVCEINPNSKFLSDVLFQVVNVGALGDSDPTGNGMTLENAPECMACLLFGHYEWDG